MRIKTSNIVIRAFERKDAENFFRIVREKSILRFMPDWARKGTRPQDYYEPIDWSQAHQDVADISIKRPYAIALPGTDEMIGMVAVGLKETLHEVEVAYFMSEKYQGMGYTKEAIDALTQWCFEMSDVPYLILTIDCANDPSNSLAQKCGFELFEKRTPIGQKNPNMESDGYFYYRKYR